MLSHPSKVTKQVVAGLELWAFWLLSDTFIAK